MFLFTYIIVNIDYSMKLWLIIVIGVALVAGVIATWYHIVKDVDFDYDEEL